AQNADSCTLVGIDVNRVYTLTFGIGAALAGVAGVLLATIFSFNPSSGSSELLKSFVVVVLGGLGSVYGVGLALLPWLADLSAYNHNQLTRLYITIAGALAWNWMGGFVGQVSFGHAAMFGIGGFFAGQMMLNAPLPAPLCWPAGGVV